VELEAWLARLRAGEEAQARRRVGWAIQQLSEEATLVGLLADLAGHAPQVAVDTCVGTRVIHLTGVGHDFLAGLDRSRWVLVSLAAVEAVRSQVRATAQPSGRQHDTVDATLAEALADLLADRPRLTVRTLSGRRLLGDLHAVGDGVITLRVGPGEPASHVVVDRIAEVLVTP
jgi:hypothetical protein